MKRRHIKKAGRFVGAGLALLVLFAVFVAGCAKTEEERLAQKLKGEARGRILPELEDYYGVFALDEDHAWLVGSRGIILYLAEKGQKVTLLQGGVEKALYDVDFTDLQNGLIIGQEGLILKTTDGGKTWRQITFKLPLQEWQVAQPHFFSMARGADPNKVWVIGPVGTIIHSTDGGETWENLSLGRDVTLNDVFFISDTEGWAVGEFGTILHTTDAGRTWEEQKNVLNLPKFTRPDLSEEEALRRRVPPLHLEDVYLLAVAFRSSQEGYIAGESGILLRTEDRGKTWTNISSGSFNTLLSVSMVSASSGLEFATGVLGTMAAPRNGKWEILPEIRERVLTWIRDVSFAKKGSFGLACGGKGTILLTDDGGETWKEIDKDKLAQAAVEKST